MRDQNPKILLSATKINKYRENLDKIINEIATNPCKTEEDNKRIKQLLILKLKTVADYQASRLAENLGISVLFSKKLLCLLNQTDINRNIQKKLLSSSIEEQALAVCEMQLYPMIIQFFNENKEETKILITQAMEKTPKSSSLYLALLKSPIANQIIFAVPYSKPRQPKLTSLLASLSATTAPSNSGSRPSHRHRDDPARKSQHDIKNVIFLRVTSQTSPK